MKWTVLEHNEFFAIGEIKPELNPLLTILRKNSISGYKTEEVEFLGVLGINDAMIKPLLPFNNLQKVLN